MLDVSISWDLTIALAKKDMKETEETAQVKSNLMNVLSRPMLTVLVCTPFMVPISHVLFWHISTSWSPSSCFVWTACLDFALFCSFGSRH